MGVRRVIDLHDEEDEEFDTPAVTTLGKRTPKQAEPEPEFEDEDEEEVPSRASIVQAGWDSAKKAMANAGGFTDEFKFTDSQQVVKFLSSDPIAVYRQHWLDQKEGKKSFVCLGARCPLCRLVGDSPSQKIAFSVLNLSTPGNNGEPFAPQLLIVGTRLANQLEKLNNDPKVGPLDKAFWALSKTGVKQQTSYSAVPVKPRDLAEDWDINPDDVTTAAITVKALDSSVIRTEPMDSLMEIARDLAA